MTVREMPVGDGGWQLGTYPELVEQGSGLPAELVVPDAFGDEVDPGSVDERDERRLVHQLVIDSCPLLVGHGSGRCHRLADLCVYPAVAELRPVGVVGAARGERGAAQQRVDEVGGRRVVRYPEQETGLCPVPRVSGHRYIAADAGEALQAGRVAE